MKRGADRQLTRDEFDGGDVEGGDVEPESTSETGFKKASDEILKTRKIRALPNRTKPSAAQSNGTTVASSLFQPPPSVASSGSAFTLPPAATNNSFASPAAFSSDSTNSSSSSPFAKFDTPAIASNPPQISSAFNSTSTPLTTSFTFPSSSDKPVTFAPSSTAKAFASVLNKSDSNILGFPSPNTPSSSSNQAAAAGDEDDPVLFQYYINLRGLNHSLVNTISKGIEDDPFADMSGFLESYKSMYLKIQQEQDDASPTSKPESSSISSTPKPSPSNFFSMPAAPSPFGKPSGQGAQSSISTSGVSSTPSATSTSFFSQPSAGAQSFGFPSSTGSKMFNASNETPAPSLFGTPSQKPSLFTPEQSSSTTTASTFGSTSSPFKFGGSSSTANQSSPSIFGSSTSATPFKWGATADPATSDKIGATDNSLTTTSTLTPTTNNAVHFQFGSGSSGDPQLQSKTATSADEKTTDDAADGERSGQATSAAEGGGEASGSSSNLLATHNPHDDEGEGEENEISVHAIKVKAYRMKKADEKGGPSWADLGFGILRLKKDKDTSSRRMLLRNSTNGKILINFKIYSGLKPSLAKKALTFVGHDNGDSQTYCVRLPGEEQAQQLKAALDKEIESVTTAKEEE